MKKIEQLTADQESRLAEFRDKWIAIGLSTEPADRPRAEAAIRIMYRSAGLAEPNKIVWCGSPLFLEGKFSQAVGDSVGDSVADSIRDFVQLSAWDSVRDSVSDSVWDSVWASVGASVGASVWDSVWPSVRASVGASASDSVWDSSWDSGYGQHDANWLAFYDFFMEACGLRDETARLLGLIEQAKSAGWYLPYANICYIAERPTVLRRNDRGQLHCVSGPAMAYPDGFSIYALNGVRVPEELAEEKK